MKKQLLSTIITVGALGASLFVTPTIASADTTCTTVYGGGTNCASTNLTINKTVQDPQSGSFVDNLTVNGNKFTSGQTVTFHITVTNTGNGNMSDVVVTDVLPQFLNFSSGPGSFNASTSTLTDDIGGLNAGQSATITVQAIIANNISAGTTCLTNQSFAAGNGQSVQDNAQLCVQNAPTKGSTLQVFPAPKLVTTPPTGPETFGMLGLVPASIAGLLMRRKSKKVSK